ncbi:hypothetical protein ZTR_09017 [Talaromyces verruculosus]|nr:hypothetical protein ZTR_09017 [Talaromyces verruculosus]
MPLFSHYGDLPDISYRLSYPSLFFCIFTPLVVIARLVSRKVFAGKVGVDDWTILASAMFAEVVSIQIIFLCEWTFGKHVGQIQDTVLLAKTLKENPGQVYFVAQILYKVNIGLTKISILLLYLKIFVTQWFQRTCQVSISIIIAFTIGTVMSSIFQCTPIAFAFDKTEKGTCIDLTAFCKSFCFMGFSLVCITSILRITTLDLATSHLDVTWNSLGSSMWTVIEANLGIFCASLPAFRPALASFFPTFFGRNRATAYYESSQSRPIYYRGTKSNIQQTINGWNELQESGSRTHSHGDLVDDSDLHDK